MTRVLMRDTPDHVCVVDDRAQNQSASAVEISGFSLSLFTLSVNVTVKSLSHSRMFLRVREKTRSTSITNERERLLKRGSKPG
jgi:hypothetical protein